MVTALYRKSSLEVLRISMQHHLFEDVDQEYYAIIENPSFIGISKKDIASHRRENGRLSLIVNPQKNTIGIASEESLEKFDEVSVMDKIEHEKKQAMHLANDNPIFSRFAKAVMTTLMQEINKIREELQLEHINKGQIRKNLQNNFMKGD